MIKNRMHTQGLDQHVIEGIRRDLAGMGSLPLDGKVYTPATLEARIQARIDAASAILAAKATWQHAIATYEAEDEEVSRVVGDLKGLVEYIFGRQCVQLADFGFAPRKQVTLTEEQKVVAVAKRAATRKARGTLGPKAKLRITGASGPTGGSSGVPS